METQLSAHPFQRTLGPGPYKFIGAGRIAVSETFGARYIGPECEAGVGTCAHCGNGIMNIFVIETAEKRRFGVGSDCIMKAGMPAKELTAVQRAVRSHQAQLRDARKVAKGEAAREELKSLLEANSYRFSVLPHPSIPSKTLLDYFNYCSERSSHGGLVLALKRAKEYLVAIS